VPSNLAFAALMATGARAGFYFGGNLLELAGTIAPARSDPWRMALLCLSLFALPLLAGLLLPDPPRTAVAESSDDGSGALASFLSENRREFCFLGAAGGARCRGAGGRTARRHGARPSL